MRLSWFQGSNIACPHSAYICQGYCGKVAFTAACLPVNAFKQARYFSRRHASADMVVPAAWGGKQHPEIIPIQFVFI